MSYTRLSLDPDGYWHSATKATTGAKQLELAGQHALKTLSGLAHMGGDDQTGRQFAHGYDNHAAKIFNELGDLCSALSQTAAAFGASAASHANAESANSGSTSVSQTIADPPAAVVVQFDHPASAYGGTNIFPTGWTLLQSFISMTWPDGDTGKMRRGRAAWNALADEVDQATSTYISTLLDPLQGFRAPDIAAITAKISVLEPAARDISGMCRDLAEGCGSYADAIDTAHREAGNQLEEFIITTAVAIGISVALTPLTAGISDLVGGGAVAADAAITAGEISVTFGRVVKVVGPLLVKLGDASRAGAGTASFFAKAGVFTGKSIAVSAVWGASSVYGDYEVNGNKADPVDDLKYALVSGFFAEGGKVAGEALSASARGAMTGTAKAAAEVAGEEVPEVAGKLAEPAADSIPVHGRRSAVPDSLIVKVTTGGIKAATNIVGTGLGSAGGDLATGEFDPSKLPGEVAKDGAEGLLPIVKPGGVHLTPPLSR